MRGMSKRLASKVLTGLAAVTLAAGTATAAAIDGFESGSKTKGAVIWMSIVITIVFLGAALAIAFKDSRRSRAE